MNTNEFLAYFQNVKKHSSNQYTALCPAHGDKHNSLSIGYRSDKSHWLIYCHAGAADGSVTGHYMQDVIAKIF